MDEKVADVRLPNKKKPNVERSLAELEVLGVQYIKIDIEEYEKGLKEVRSAKLLNYADECTINRDVMPNYDEKVKMFAEEHLHTDEEVRFVLEGSGYFDVRDKEDRWVRIMVVVGDLIILPAGIYHRFVVDTNDYIKAIRLFSGVPVWTPYNRPADDMGAREKYLNDFKISSNKIKSNEYLSKIETL